jgi:hypothetical protein
MKSFLLSKNISAIESKSYGFTDSIDSNLSRIQMMVDAAILSERWISEGIEPPTMECKILAKDFISKLYNDFQLFPRRISATVEEGIYVDYFNIDNERELSIEIYNDLDAAALVTKKNKIILSIDINLDINHDTELYKLINAFYDR